MKEFLKTAVIIYGPPGSGKGTQAELLAKKLDLIHFDTGRFIERAVNNPKKHRDPIIQREKELFNSGQLNTPDWVLKIVVQKTKDIAKAGWGLVFSGSPRTVYEAFGNDTTEGLLKILEKLYGRKNLFIFLLKVKPAVSLSRNSQRLVCSHCDKQMLGFYSKLHKKICPLCGAALKKRILDKPETIKIRLQQFKERTDPIFTQMKKRGYTIHPIDGEVPPYDVFGQIIKILVK